VSSTLASTPHGGEHKIDRIGVEQWRRGDAPARDLPLMMIVISYQMADENKASSVRSFQPGIVSVESVGWCLTALSAKIGSCYVRPGH